jgi:hypothetical protein
MQEAIYTLDRTHTLCLTITSSVHRCFPMRQIPE